MGLSGSRYFGFTERELDMIYDALEKWNPSESSTFTEDEIERLVAKIVPPYKEALDG